MGYGSDVENALTATSGPFAEKQVRLAFVRKVYSILSCQLLVTFLPVISLTIYRTNNEEKVDKFLDENGSVVLGVLLGSIIFMFTLSCALACCESVRRTHPWNMVCLSIYTLATTVLVTFCTIPVDAQSVALAVALTAGITIGLTIFAFQTKIDFTVYYQLAFVILLCLLMFGIAASFMRNNIMNRVYGLIGAILFSFFIVIDTQLIIGGGRFEISPEEYVLAALTLYMDIINLFLKLLQLFGRR